MHLGRFHRAIELLATEYQEIKHAELILQVANALNAVVANPGNPSVATTFKNQLDTCRMTIESTKLSHTRPILKSILNSINAEEFIGTGLTSRIVATIAENQAVPALAVQELSNLYKEVIQFYQHITSIDTAFSTLQVEYDDLGEGEAEIGLLIPKTDNASSLKDLSKEFNEWHNALTSIAQLFDKEAGPLQIRNCATTDWTVYLVATPPILFGVSMCVKGVNSILRELVSTRSLIEQLININGSSDHTDGLLADNDKGFDKKIRELGDSLVDKHAKDVDSGTQNQMKNGINIALKLIASKINSGAKIELRLIPTNASENEESDDEAKGESVEQALIEKSEMERLNALAASLDNEIDLLSFDGMSDSLKSLLELPKGDSHQDAEL